MTRPSDGKPAQGCTRGKEKMSQITKANNMEQAVRDNNTKLHSGFSKQYICLKKINKLKINK